MTDILSLGQHGHAFYTIIIPTYNGGGRLGKKYSSV